MKNKKISGQTNILKQNSKSRLDILKKSNKKQFQLLYRQRDSSTDDNRIESIIFVKSKRIKPDQKKCKSKVKQSFQKIMDDLQIHLSQHKSLKGDSKYFQKELSSTKPSQLKSTVSFKRSSKQNHEILKSKKITQRSQNKPLKKWTSPNKQSLTNTNINQCKSPKKKENNFMSPSKNYNKAKTPNKHKKQNINSIQNVKLQSKTLHSPNKTYQHEKKSNKSKNKQYNSNSDKIYNKSQSNKFEQFKKGIKKIPLKVQQYLLVDNDFELIENPKTINRLQTKLLSTHRNFTKQTNRNQQNEQKIIFQKIKLSSPSNVKRSYQTFIQREEQNDLSEFNIQEDKQEENIFQNSQYTTLNSLKKYFDQKVVLIQKWWRKILQKNNEKIQKQKQKQKYSSFQESLPAQKNNQDKLRQIIFNGSSVSSSQSIQFGGDSHKNNVKNQQIYHNQGENLIKKRKKIAQQKKETHKSILIKFLRDRKITQIVFNQKMCEIEKQYKKDLEEVLNLEKILKINEELIKETQVKIQQDKKLAQYSQKDQQVILEKIFGSESQAKKSQYLHNSQQDLDNQQDLQQENETEIKKYKIGGKISSQMQQYISCRKKTQGYHESSQNLQNYNKKTNELGQQYYQDFQSQHSSTNSPHKSFDTDDVPDFVGDDHGRVCSFQPNTNFSLMIEQLRQQQQIKVQIQKRIAIQMGVFKQSTQIPILDTSIIGMHQFLINFFKFYLYYYKDEFLRLINMPYGYSPQKRLQFIQGYVDQSDQLTQDADGIIYGLEFIISDDVLDTFLQQYYDSAFEQASYAQKQMIQFAKIHSRAIFDCFNHALNNFRPYYNINGPPYQWNSSEKALTFYFIAQQNIQQVFEKTQFRVLKWASSLVGLIVDQYEHHNLQSQSCIDSNELKNNYSLDKLLASYQSCAHPSILQNRQQRLTKQQRSSIVDTMLEWSSFEQQKASTLYEVSSAIYQELIAEFVQEMNNRNIIQSNQ